MGAEVLVLRHKRPIGASQEARMRGRAMEGAATCTRRTNVHMHWMKASKH